MTGLVEAHKNSTNIRPTADNILIFDCYCRNLTFTSDEIVLMAGFDLTTFAGPNADADTAPCPCCRI